MLIACLTLDKVLDWLQIDQRAAGDIWAAEGLSSRFTIPVFSLKEGG